MKTAGPPNPETGNIDWFNSESKQIVLDDLEARVISLDDTDTERSEARFEAAIREDLTWLGLTWDEEARQCDRLELA